MPCRLCTRYHLEEKYSFPKLSAIEWRPINIINLYDEETAKKLFQIRKSGWKLKKSVKFDEDNISINTKSFKKYFFYK